MSSTDYIVALLAIIVALLAIMTGLLAVIARRKPGSADQERLQTAVNAAIQELGLATQKYVEVNAVEALMREYKSAPELMAKLLPYNRELVAAALTRIVQSTSAQIITILAALETQRRYQAETQGLAVYTTNIKQLTGVLEDLNQKLATAHATLKMFEKDNA